MPLSLDNLEDRPVAPPKSVSIRPTYVATRVTAVRCGL